MKRGQRVKIINEAYPKGRRSLGGTERKRPEISGYGKVSKVSRQGGYVTVQLSNTMSRKLWGNCKQQGTSFFIFYLDKGECSGFPGTYIEGLKKCK